MQIECKNVSLKYFFLKIIQCLAWRKPILFLFYFYKTHEHFRKAGYDFFFSFYFKEELKVFPLS